MIPHWGEALTSPQQVFPYAFRAGPLQARPHILSPYFSGPILSWTSFLSFSGPPSARPIFHVSLFPGALCTGARRPGASLSGSPCCAALCVTRSMPDVANTRIMPRESGLHASRAMKLGVQTPERGANRLTCTKWWQHRQICKKYDCKHVVALATAPMSRFCLGTLHSRHIYLCS